MSFRFGLCEFGSEKRRPQSSCRLGFLRETHHLVHLVFDSRATGQKLEFKRRVPGAIIPPSSHGVRRVCRS
jgi:hypothetical protein